MIWDAFVRRLGARILAGSKESKSERCVCSGGSYKETERIGTKQVRDKTKQDIAHEAGWSNMPLSKADHHGKPANE